MDMTKFRTLLAVIALGAGTSVAAEPATFPTPQDAFEALTTAVDNRDAEAFEAIFGAENVDLLVSENDAENAVNRLAFKTLVDEGFRFQRTEQGVILILGAEDWPFPVPILRGPDGWHFDAEAGRQEIRDREIGLNELAVIDLLLAYVDLQTQFRQVDYDADGVMEFAQTIISSADERNGLFWPGGPGFVGQALARAELQGWSDGLEDFEPEPFLGYYFAILHGQGPAAPGGNAEYLVGGNMVAGHAMLAVPADYDGTGIHSFLIGENGILYEADLGEDTLAQAAEMDRYNPDDVWSVVE